MISAIFFSVVGAVRPTKVGALSINIVTAPLIATFCLLALGVIDFGTLADGLIGNGSIVPWQILVIFFTVAYVSISTDLTGLFDVLAFRIVRIAKGNTKKLFIGFFILTAVFTIFTSNDIVILTLTPIILYLGKHADIQVIPFLFAEYFAANTLDALLVIGSPTNIIIANALSLGFLDYFQTMFVPTLVATITTLITLLILYRKGHWKDYTVNRTHVYVKSVFDIRLSAILLLTMFVTLLFSERLNVPIWTITSIFAGIFITIDTVSYFFTKPGVHPIRKEVLRMKDEECDTYAVLKRMPWSILPFITTMFIIIGSLMHTDLAERIVTLISRSVTNEFEAVFTFGAAGALLVNVINDQPMSILLSGILTHPALTLSPAVHTAAAYATALASNLGTNLTLIGALAGLMWARILKEHSIHISYFQFLKVGIVVMPIVTFSSLLTLWVVLVLT